MYLTSGANVRTRRSRTLRSPVVWYCCQSARDSSAETRPRVGDCTDIGGTPSAGNEGERRGEQRLYRPMSGGPISPIVGFAQDPSVQAAHPQKWGWPSCKRSRVRPRLEAEYDSRPTPWPALQLLRGRDDDQRVAGHGWPVVVGKDSR